MAKRYTSVTYFLDALDEALLRIDQISAVLITKLQKYPVERLYLRIACRTADWPNDLEQGVYGLWGKNSVKTYELVPLQRRDVIEAAQANGLDPEAFLKEIVRVEVVPLAIKPVTLELLINTYRRHGNLPKTQADLYLEGCRLLCEVPSWNQSRSARSRYILTADQRLATAARIAAITLFARRAAIWTDIDRGDVPDDDVTIRDLSGGKEPSNGTKFELTERGVWETLGTGLFSSRGPNRLGWSHQTYAEFLAARHLHKSDLTLPQMMSLIVHPHDPEKKIVPQLHEAAAWLATMVPEVFREIVKCDPQVLLKNDVASAVVKDREALVQSLLQLHDQEQILDFDWDIRKTYRKLNHPRLADQLRPYIVDDSKGITVRRVAIDIAEECGIKVLEKELISILLDRAHPQAIRVHAAHAVSEIADEATKLLLKPLALNSGDDDEDDQLKGVALATLWPSQMTADELFTALKPPKRTNLVGLYQLFIASEFVKDIQPNDLPTALNWVEKQSGGRLHFSPFSGVVDAIMLRSWAHLETPDVLNAFARVAVKRLEQFDAIVGEVGVRDTKTQQFAEELIHQDEKRHRVLEVMLPLIDDLNRNWVWLVSPTPLLSDKDFRWMVMHLRSAPNEQERQKWACLIEKIAGWLEPTQLDALISKCEGYPSLVQALEKLKADYPEREKLRRTWQRERKVELIKPSPQERIAQLLDQCENKDSAAWWRLNSEMTLEPTSTNYGHEFHSDLTGLPGWKSADNQTRGRILAAAKKFLLEQGPNTPEWLDKSDIVYFPALAGYRALELLLRESPDSIVSLPPDVWKKWAPVIPTFPNKPSSDDQYYGQLIQLAYRYAPDELIQTILKIIDRENKANGSIYIIFHLRACWDERLSRFHWLIYFACNSGRLFAAFPMPGQPMQNHPLGILEMSVIVSPRFSQIRPA